MKNESYIESDEIEEMPGEAGGDILDLLARIQRQLTFMEKKVDTLLNRSAEKERSFDGERQAPKSFRKPFDRSAQRFDRPPRRNRDRDRDEGNDRDRDRDRGFKEKEFPREQYFDRRKGGRKPAGKPRAFGKKPFYSRFSE